MVDLHRRLQPFAARGLIQRVPTNWQVAQGSLEMARTVVAVKPDDRARYRGALFGHPALRTPILIAYTLGGHMRIGAGIRAREWHLHAHLLAVVHHGQPVFDLQLVQTFPNGLARLRARVDLVDAGRTAWRRWERWWIDRVVPGGHEYRERLRGYIRRAARFDYDSAVPPGVRPEFATLVSFMSYCAEAYPASWRGMSVWQQLRQLRALVTRPRLLPPAHARTGE